MWLKSGAQAYRFPKPRRGPHWLGDTPFPQNPYFHPPPPVHQSVRDDMWRLHTQSPQQWTVRSLSSKFRISLERTEAILRLKALEDVYTQEGKPLQTELQRHMERLLGSRPSFLAESQPVPATAPHSPRGAPYEERNESTTPSTYTSPLAEALKAANRNRREVMRHIPTGAPNRPDHDRTVEASREGRAPMRIVSVGADSYMGVGTLERNKKRALYRAARRSRRREKLQQQQP